MDVSIDAETEALVTRLVEDGRYASASEAVRHGLRLLEHQRSQEDELRAMIQASLAEGGEGSDDDLQAELDALAKRLEKVPA